MTPEELEARLQIIDHVFGAAMNGKVVPIDVLFECVKTIAYLQSIHRMHYLLETTATEDIRPEDVTD